MHSRNLVQAEPWTRNRIRTPGAFTPYAGQTVADGARLALFLKGQRRVVLVVERYQPGDLYDLSNSGTTLVGYVPLGQMTPGPTVVPWDFKVNGQALGPASYLIHVEGATDDDRPTGQWPPAPYSLTIRADGTVNLDVLEYFPVLEAVNLDGSLTRVAP